MIMSLKYFVGMYLIIPHTRLNFPERTIIQNVSHKLLDILVQSKICKTGELVWCTDFYNIKNNIKSTLGIHILWKNICVTDLRSLG